ncbi:bifunctional transaldolase/phosoglucose isomerase [Sphingomonas sp. JC676]|uniref:bifunctional transaldolase/phosoglucose isomerase n=1 Tax=Sphingomonas sp. JC676 TaxID=2768065 RepID=UPI001657F07D|nr:bifunctional transaldolase/phosoglucose isomerase [Sphingomonas sp. JC676]MBC9032171.1 bifunctional transaldolase/phosoglucose isomerase [Sphingomonas sp. JC676]
MTNRLKQLGEAGQAVWLDFVDRNFLNEGGLRKLVEEDGLTGVTSNPSIFEKAMGHSDAYDTGFAAFLGKGDASVQDLYESQAIADIQAAAADLRPVYDRLERRDGYVSLEVSPYLADATQATIDEARRLWAAVDVPNLMIKVPGTHAGTPAIRTLIEDGININVTLLFSLAAYQAVAGAYLHGLEARVAKGEPIDGIASVASFFVSRIDAKIDKAIDARVAAGDADSDALKALRGKVAIANAKLAYAWYQEMIASPRWQALAAKGAMPQRLLWASTGVKDPAYPDTLYIDSLIGPDTVNTIPPKTMDAFRDHGTVHDTLTEDLDGARHIIAEAKRLGLGLDDVTAALVPEGVKLFADAADALLGAVAAKRTAFLGDRENAMEATLPAALDKAVEARLETARAQAWPRRLWQGDASLWTGKDEAKWLGWLAAARGEQVDPEALKTLAERARGHKDAVLLGMGGSSLGPEVLSLILGNAEGSPRLHVLNTTDPGQIATVAAAIDPKEALFIVSSKSGSTMEPELLRAYFWALSGKDGSRFVAVTDPGSKLEATAKADGFAMIFPGDPAIGGRYSVLSAFGMVPAAAMGIDTSAFFEATAPMVFACGADVPPAANPGVRLGAILGEAALSGRDKLTILPSPGLAPFGAWLEQLVAESTGKQGKGIIPVDLEPGGEAVSYGTDRLFVHLHLEGDEDVALEAKLEALVAAGQPLVTIRVGRPELIGQEFFRWEIATAIAGAVIGIDPFDQPDVEDAKIATRKLVDAYERTGALEPATPIVDTPDFAIFGPGSSEFAATDPVELVRLHFAELFPPRYAGFLAYIERNAENAEAIEAMRVAVRDATQVATVAGFGPRFLHSTGQAYKGGPATGDFLVITRDPEPDLAIPGHRASFGTVQLAQARGDMDVLAARGQRVMRVHLHRGGRGIAALVEAVRAAVRP